MAAFGFSLFRKIPAVRRQIQEGLDKTREELFISIHEFDKERDFIRALPSEGVEDVAILDRINKYQTMEGHFDYKKVNENFRKKIS